MNTKVDDLVGPLPWKPDNRGDFIPPAEKRRRLWQCQRERDRLLDALGWWEAAPPRPDMIENFPIEAIREPQAVA